MSTMRVASYNLKDFTLDPPPRRASSAAIDPDVLCLQEVPRRLLSSCRVSAFAAECGMFWSGRHRGSGGTTIFTSLRVQVRESRHYRLRVAAAPTHPRVCRDPRRPRPVTSRSWWRRCT